MSVEELAEKMGVSTKTIYERARSRGVHYSGKTEYTESEARVIEMDVEDLAKYTMAYLRKEEKNFLVLESKMNF